MAILFRFLLLFLLPFPFLGQGSLRFEEEIRSFESEDGGSPLQGAILFTGSSSIRMWKDLPQRFPTLKVLNRGFGGSQMEDILFYYDRVIKPYRPSKVFIYEGDNDLHANKSAEEILNKADQILQKIREDFPEVLEVYFISAKPSLARWNLKDKYLKFNHDLKSWTEKKNHVYFIDVWNPMLDDGGEVQKDLFLSDGLHMNKKGYDIWYVSILSFVKK